jgi:hypothetical protein
MEQRYYLDVKSCESQERDEDGEEPSNIKELMQQQTRKRSQELNYLKVLSIPKLSDGK